ncbi:putative ribonuclease H-like domain-containing protein [Tanacetum coccineum]
MKLASNISLLSLAEGISSQSWLWHQRLSHLNFATINNLMKNNLVRGFPKMKFEKDHLCSACEQLKIHRKRHKSKTAFVSNKPLYLLHMDLCGPMRVKSMSSTFMEEFSAFSSFKEKENDRLLQNNVFKNKEEVVIKNTIRIVPK